MCCYEKIKEYILQQPQGTAFAFSDLHLFGEKEEIRNVLSELIAKEICKEFLPDIYYRPVYSQLLNKEVSPYSVSVAHAMARNNGWKISPSFIHAVNQLGLSTQIPAYSIFLSTGPSHKYIFNGIPVEFVHCSDKYLKHMSYVPAMVVTALQAIDNEKSMLKAVVIIAERLNDEHKDVLKSEIPYAPEHIQPFLIQISNS